MTAPRRLRGARYARGDRSSPALQQIARDVRAGRLGRRGGGAVPRRHRRGRRRAARLRDGAPRRGPCREARRRRPRSRRPVSDPGPLAGVPVALKDNLCTRGVPTTCSSRILDGWCPPYDATVVERLRAAGAVVIGKTNLDEFAMGSSTENSAFGAHPQPLRPGPCPGRLVGGLGGRRGRRAGPAGARLGHGRLDPPARRPVRRRGHEAHLRDRVALRARGLRQLARPDRAPSRPRWPSAPCSST